MATLRTRTLASGATTYSVLFRDAGRQTSETFDSDRAAAAFMRDITRHGPATARRVLDTRRPGSSAPMRTVTDQLTAHVDALSGITLGTRRRYQALTRTIALSPLGGLPVEIVTRADVTAWVRTLQASGLSAKTVSMRQTLLSSAFQRAVDDELMVRNPAHGVRVGRSERREMTFLTPGEFARLIGHVPAEWQPLIVTLVGTGLRFGEATALQAQDVHLDDNPPTLTVSRGWQFTDGAGYLIGAPKTARGRRTISLPPEVADVLRPLIDGAAPTAWVLTDRGGPIRNARVQPLWRKWLAAADLGKRPRLHDLRHTHASWLIAQGVPLTTVQHRLGHASIKITADTYTHMMPEAQVQSARAASLGLTNALPLIEG